MNKYRSLGIGLVVLLTVLFVTQTTTFARADKEYKTEKTTVTIKEFAVELWNWVQFGQRDVEAVTLPEGQLVPVQRIEPKEYPAELVGPKEYPAEKIGAKEYPVQRLPEGKLEPIK